ncbi:MAG: AAA family ATPase [Lachnospiraceae bacterium]|nr:AAA family ATPase [Lachnospiraceae bacterium]
MEINVDIDVDFLWGNEHFIKNEWGKITYIVGPNGTGKTIVAEKLKEQFKKAQLKVRYFSAERLNNLGNKWDDHGYLQSDKLSNGLNIGNFSGYKSRADALGQSIDAIIELRNKMDLQIKIESILSDIFGKTLSFKETGGYLNVTMEDSGKVYDLKKDESHGLKEIITLLAFLYDDEYNCIILDEPELNLHPQFQQYILQEIKSMAGDPFQEQGKKMFVILTHSPYMLSIQNSDELKNLVVFHRHEVPTFIKEYEDMDEYQKLRLNKLLLRMNVNHKTLFFADKPIFVEGYIDQQFFNILQYKRAIPLGAEGISIIDVGGKDEIDIMYSLCRLLKINAFCIIDMDGLFEGKLRQSVDKISDTGTFMAQKGKDPLMKSIGNIDKLLNEEVEELLKSKNELLQGELKDFYDVLKAQSGDKANMMQKRIMFLGLHRIKTEISTLLSAEGNRKLLQIEGLSKDIFECFNSVNVYFLEKGEIENYYVTDIGNQYQIADKKKTDYYLQEFQKINEMDKAEIEEKYSKGQIRRPPIKFSAV